MTTLSPLPGPSLAPDVCSERTPFRRCHCGVCHLCCVRRFVCCEEPHKYTTTNNHYGIISKYIYIALELLTSFESKEAATAVANLWSLSQIPYGIRKTSSTRVKPSANLGVYIVYMEPSNISNISLKIAEAKEYISSAIGRDESYQHPPLHCSLTGFFSVLGKQAKCNKENITQSLQEAVRKFLKTEGSSDGSPYLMRTGEMDAKRSNDLYLRKVNQNLKWVKVSDNHCLVIPLDDRWWRSPPPSANAKSRIEQLSHMIETELRVWDVDVINRRTGYAGIKAKNADHISILSSKNRPVPLSQKQATKAAIFFDRLFASMKSLSWDLVIYEVQEWGDAWNPHILSEVMRVPQVAVQTA